MGVPLRQEHLEQRPKEVLVAKSWADRVGLESRPDLEQALGRLRRAIERGAPLPTGFYRKGVGVTPDELLEREGIMHLHLGKPNTPELLFLMQFDDHVVLLELSDHRHFATDPPGSLLRSLHKQAVKAARAERQDRDDAESRRTSAAVKQGIRRRKEGPES